jgi:asparagine synthetase B (glutamine-hydrolysing)
MCGIVGRAGVLNTNDERIFKTLLLLDYFRGQDSTGVATVSKLGKVDVLKVADDPIMLFQQVDFDSTVVGVSDAIWIGHNRAATIGSTTRANAHPFKCNNITGVHNGTLEKSSFIALGARMEREYGTDSETVFQHIALYGIDETVSRMQGAWALVWYDAKDETLNMLKNHKRPLYLCNTERDGTKMLTWASEFKMIVAARAMADVADGKLITDDDGYGFFPLPNDVLHTWTKEQLLAGDLEPKTRPLEGMPDPVVTTYVTSAYANSASSTCSTGAEVNKPPRTSSFSLVEDVHELMDIELDDEDNLILGVMEKEEWEEISRYGCSCCGADVQPDEEGIVVYTNEGVVICPKCSDEPKTIVSNSWGMQMNNDRIMG